MPVRNCADYIDQALSSVLQQSITTFEVLVVDDGSTDSTREIVERCAQRDQRVKLLSNPGSGISDALNFALANSSNDMIARMDGDDVCLPDRFEAQLLYLSRHLDIAGVGSQVEWIDETGTPKGKGRYPVDWRDCEAFLKIGSPFCHPAMMIRREAILKAGGYRKAFDGAEDIDLWLRMSKESRLANIDGVHLKYRVHGNNFSGQWKEKAVARLLAARLEAAFPEMVPQVPAEDELSVDALLETRSLAPARAFILFHLFAYMALGNKPNPKYLPLLEEYAAKVKTAEISQNRAIDTFWMMRLVRSCRQHGLSGYSKPILHFLLLNRIPDMAREILVSKRDGAGRSWSDHGQIEPVVKAPA